MKPGNIVEKHQRDVEGVAEPDEPRRLVGSVDVERAAEHHRLVGETPTGRPPNRARPVTMFFAHSGLIQKHVPVIDDGLHDFAHVVCPPGRGRDDVVELLDPPIARVLRLERTGVRHDCWTERTTGTPERSPGIRGRLRPRGRRTPRSWYGQPTRPSPPRVTSSPTAALTRCRPPSAIDDVPFTMGTKSASPGIYGSPSGTVTEHRRDHRDDTAHRDLLPEQVAHAGEG